MRNLAIIEHVLEGDVLRTLAWESSGANDCDCSHVIVYDRPKNAEVEELYESLCDACERYAGYPLALLRMYPEDEVSGLKFELGYWDIQINFWPIQEFELVNSSLDDIEYCATQIGIEFRAD